VTLAGAHLPHKHEALKGAGEGEKERKVTQGRGVVRSRYSGTSRALVSLCFK
jgi:hypothetical protein